MDLLLTHGYFLHEDPKELRIMKPYAPLGLLYLSSYLRAQGFTTEIYDSTFGSREELLRTLETETPSVLGIYGTLLTRASVLAITREARERGWTVVLGGPEPASYAQQYLEAGANFVVEGEGELTLRELLAMLRSGDSAALERVAGLYSRRLDGSVAYGGPRAQIADLDSLPWPDRERIDIGRYLKVWKQHHGRSSVSVITARGCPYHCRWCSHSTFGKTHRRRSPRSVADEVESIVDRYDPQMLWMADDVFTIHPGWIVEYAREIKQRGIRVPFECITRADRLDVRVADALAELACFRVWIGSESGSQRVLDAMERSVSVEQVRRAVGLCRERGMQTGMFLMWGYEGEEESDIEATVEHVKACAPDEFFTTVSYPIKGTPYFDEVESRLVSPQDWARTTDREFKIRGRRSRRYFHFADQLLRSEVELHRLAELGGGAAESRRLREQIGAARAGLQASRHEVEA